MWKRLTEEGGMKSQLTRTLVVALLALATIPTVRSQSAQTFEVVSIRRAVVPPNPNGVPVFDTVGGVGTSSPERITYRATWITRLISEAYGIRSDDITGPAWLSTDRYDIIANIPPGATKDDFKLMLADLLRERFRLKFHMCSKILPVYALRVGKDGPKFKPTRRTADATVPSGGSITVDADGCSILPPDRQGAVGRAITGGMCWTAQEVTMANLASMLAQPAGRRVVDETGLTGRYDYRIRLQWMSRMPDANAVDTLPGVFTAVEEQLGLKLESSTSSYPELIIDSIEREPTEN
jgi:uncharacterized protein (TIGR03435 family)